MVAQLTFKISMLVIILIDGLFFGHLPYLIQRYMQNKSTHGTAKDIGANPLLLSILNCYAAGIFFATCILHMLPEISEKMSTDVFPDIEYPVAELIVGCGFFIVLSLEQIVMSCCTKSKKSKKKSKEINNSNQNSNENTDIHLNGIRGPMGNGVEDHSVGTHLDGSLDRSGTQLLIDAQSGQPYVAKDEGHSHGHGHEDDDQHDDHAHFDPAAHSTLRVLILVGALALHAVFEGLVFGVSQEPVSAMLGTAVAVVIHKSIIAFSTGMQLLTSKMQTRFLVTAVVIFSIMAPIGLIIGIILSAYGGDGNLDGPMTIIEAVATGTFIYVTFLELVPHEFMGEVEQGPLKVLVMALGFGTMAFFQTFDYDPVFMSSNSTLPSTDT